MNNKNKQIPLDDEQISELREIFRSFDKNNDGRLTELELRSLLRSLLNPNPEEFETLIQKSEANDNGLVEFDEFIAMVSPELVNKKPPFSKEKLWKMFKFFDKDENGVITPVELATGMAKLRYSLTAEELTGMIKEADVDGDGQIDFDEFSQVMYSAAFNDSRGRSNVGFHHH